LIDLWFYVPFDTKWVISETFPETNLLAWYGKLTYRSKNTHSSIERNVLQHKINTKKLKPGLVAFYDIRPGKGAGLFSKGKTSKGGDKWGKSG